MDRFAGIKHNHICLVSDYPFESDLELIKVSKEFDYVSDKDLILHGRIVNGEIKFKNVKKPAKELKIAFVTNFRQKCGISSYAENLYPEFIKHVKHVKLFIEIGTDSKDSENLVSCWKRGEKVTELVKNIKKYEPDIVLINHEWGLHSRADNWLSLMSQLSDYRVIVIMHSVFHHKDKTVCEAAMPEIITHLHSGKDVLLNEKKISGTVHVVPHGCFPHKKEKLWNFYNSEHTVIQAGFLFPYKGWSEALKTIAILKDKYPDIFFTGLCSESEKNKVTDQIYYNELTHLIDELKIQDNVGLIRGYQSEESWNSYLRINKVALFPYIAQEGHVVHGVSGAAREAMSKGIPVVSSNVNHFSDMPSIKANSPEQMANEIDKLFSNNKLIEKQIKIQDKFLEENSWENVVKKYIKIFES
jgi:glycosyltransferase involved in cell wall biosynthesis